MRESALFSSLVTRALATQHSHYTKRDAHLRYRKPTEIVRVILLCVQLLKKSDPLHRDRPNREKELYTAPRRVACGASPRPPLTPSAYPSQRASWRNRRRQQLPSPHTAPLIAAHSSSASSHSPPCRRSTGPPWPCSPVQAVQATRTPAQQGIAAGIISCCRDHPSCCRGTLVRYSGQAPRSGTPVEQGAEAARRHTHLLQKL